MNRPALSPPRRRLGCTLALALPATLTALLLPLREPLNLVSDSVVFLGATVVVALVGGLLPAVIASLLASALLNFFFTPPLHRLTVADPNNVLALIVFLAVAMAVSSAVDQAARWRRSLDEEAARNAALAETDRLRTALLQAVSHDLRAPLAAAKTSVSAILGTPLADEDRAALLAGADRSLDRLTDLVENLLALSRLQAGALPLAMTATDVEEVLSTTLGHLDAVEPITVDLADGLPEVYADPGLLERVLANLVGNASRHGTGPIVIDADQYGDRVRICIRDRGPGVPADKRERMFVPFQREGDTETRGGLGLGLALARGLVEAMGGTLTPETTHGGGLTMAVTLAVAR